MLWLVIGLMLLVAAFVVAWPQYQQENRVSARSLVAIVSVIAFSAGLYAWIGEPDTPTAAVADSTVQDMVDSLARRLETETDDLDGWKMLGRSYFELKRYNDAIVAYERAAALESYSNAETLVNLGETIMLMDGNDVSDKASQLFENALALEPDNPKALFYGGIAAINRGAPLLAADRWEKLLASSPPEEIQGVLRQRIAEWRGIDAPTEVTETAGPDAVELIINVQIDAAAVRAVDPDSTVFVIVRDPAQRSPPIAAVRRQASELPFEVTLSDSDSMIPGRVISNYRNLELVVRVSGSGQPIAQSGDWYGELAIDTETTQSLDIMIDRQVP